MANKKHESEHVVLERDHTSPIDHAIAEGRSLIEQGKTKVEASMVIYRALEEYSQEEVVAAMIDGARLTPKGALTYWYNCRRRIKREKAMSK